MKKYKRVITKILFLSMLTRPIFVFVYGISFYELYTLARFGRFNNNIAILSVCMVFFLAWLIVFIIRAKRNPVSVPKQIIDRYEFNYSGINILQEELQVGFIQVSFQDIKSFGVDRKYGFIKLKNKDILVLNMLNKTPEEINMIKKALNDSITNKAIYKFKVIYKVIWIYVAIILIVFITLFYGAKIYHSAINYNGKLSWIIQDLKDERNVEFKNNDIYKDGIEGIFTDINEKIHMPERLYVSDGFKLYFDSDGIITYFDTFLYGKNDKGELESYLISYDSNKSKKITVSLNRNVNADYNEDKLLKPLIDTMKVIPLKNTVSKWRSNKYGILYYGKRSFGYNTEGIIYINSKGERKSPNIVSSEIVGNTVSVYVPGKEDIDIPVRYILVDNFNKLNKTEQLKPLEPDNDERFYGINKKTEEFYLSDKVGYRLGVTDAELGSRFYALYGTKDAGATWKVINGDPFSGWSGGAAGITFLNDKLGFLALSHSGGSYADLYRTDDGGLSYKKVELPEVKIKLDEEKTYNPFDFPGMPYKEDGILKVLVGQGSDGDYNKVSNALYESKDEGKTWKYVKEVARD